MHVHKRFYASWQNSHTKLSLFKSSDVLPKKSSLPVQSVCHQSGQLSHPNHSSSLTSDERQAGHVTSISSSLECMKGIFSSDSSESLDRLCLFFSNNFIFFAISLSYFFHSFFSCRSRIFLALSSFLSCLCCSSLCFFSSFSLAFSVTLTQTKPLVNVVLLY